MVFGEGIIERLPEHSALHNPDNPFRKVFINTVGALLDDFDIYDSMEGVYLQEADNVYLDRHGDVLGVPRKLDESDEHYRFRLTYEVIGSITAKYLIDVYGLTLYTFVDDFNPADNTLVSDNPYFNYSGFMVVVDDETKEILERKFVIGEELQWVSL